ncbi:thiamine phosphate synthase [Dongia rigui]|uniref:thiamine phosphate synthase n=1 Tax=Dongia rigui TaxID=940149 RepID=UPI0038994C6B
MSAFADLLEKTIAAADIACLRIAGDDAARISTIAKPLLPLAQDQGVAVLFDDADLALKLRGDGVHLADPMLLTKARRTVGSDAIVGVACPLERHAAMEAGEAGADYVQFQPGTASDDLDLIAWWTEMMTVPSVVAGKFSQESARAFVAAGADFLAPDPSIWATPDAVAAIAALLS